MYHRFDENKYPSTNIRIDDFKSHINLIRDSNLKFISQGEVNIGISYLSDALLSPKVKILSNIDYRKIKYEQPTYWAAKINKNSKNNGLNFINWLESRKAQNIIKNYGFESIYSEENY